VSLGYAVTVHSAQGVTADTSHAVLGENTTRALLYVAMTRGRHTNTTHLYQRTSGDQEYGQQEPGGTHVKYRGDGHEAADLIRGILANHDQLAVTAHDYAARTPGAALPERVQRLLDSRSTAVDRRRDTYDVWSAEAREDAQSMAKSRAFAASRSQACSADAGIEL
jgi:hypothetical protein